MSKKKSNPRFLQLGKYALLLTMLVAARQTSLAANTNLISNTSFEANGRPRYSYPYEYVYGGPNPGSSQVLDTAYFDPNDTLQTNAMAQFTFDTSAFLDYPLIYPGAGYGFGFGGKGNFSGDASTFTSTNLSDYVLSFDLRVEGLSEGLHSANGEFQLRFDAPDDTLQPPDADTASDVLLQVNLPVTGLSNWTHQVLTLDQGRIGDGSLQKFAQFKTRIENVNFGFNWNNAGDYFGFDADNGIYMDNIRLELVQGQNNGTPAGGTEIPVLDWNFDDKPIFSNYQYAYSPNNSWPDFIALANIDPFGVGGSNANVLTFDSSTFTNGIPAYAGAGTGFHGPIDKAQFTTGDLALYRLKFDYNVAGLAPGITSTPGHLVLTFHAGNTPLLSIGYDVALTTNWQSFSSLLKSGSLVSGSPSLFAANLANINEVQADFNVTAVPGDFGMDADNRVALDNFKLSRVVTSAPALTIARTGANIVVTWPGTGILQSATSISGPYTDVSGATSPYIAPLQTGAKFFRTR
jgi:hypothetical protein